MLESINHSANKRKALHKPYRLRITFQSSLNSPDSCQLFWEKAAIPRSPLIKGTTQAEIDLPF